MKRPRSSSWCPVKPPAVGKSRLRGVDDDVRRDWPQAFALDTVAACLRDAVGRAGAGGHRRRRVRGRAAATRLRRRSPTASPATSTRRCAWPRPRRGRRWPDLAPVARVRRPARRCAPTTWPTPWPRGRDGAAGFVADARRHRHDAVRRRRRRASTRGFGPGSRAGAPRRRRARARRRAGHAAARRRRPGALDLARRRSASASARRAVAGHRSAALTRDGPPPGRRRGRTRAGHGLVACVRSGLLGGLLRRGLLRRRLLGRASSSRPPSWPRPSWPSTFLAAVFAPSWRSTSSPPSPSWPRSSSPAAVVFLAAAFFAGASSSPRAFLAARLLGRVLDAVFLAGAPSWPSPQRAAFLAAPAAADGAATVSFGSFLAPETTFLRSAPAVNFGTAFFLALIRAPVCGLRTQRASRTLLLERAEAGDGDLLALRDLAGDRVEHGLERVRRLLRFPSKRAASASMS